MTENTKFVVKQAGHDYELTNFEKLPETPAQVLRFIRKQENAEGQLETVANGTTNEAVIEVLINRITWLNAKNPSKFNEQAVAKLQGALELLEKRTKDRVKRKVEGTPKK